VDTNYKYWKDKYLIILFIVSTLFYLVQHYYSFSWDFISFVLSGRYWFNHGIYFEVWDPPLTAILISMFSLFGWKLAEYLFIIFVSILFLISSVKLSQALNINSKIFYLMSLSPYVLSYGLINGSELLSVIFIEFFIYCLIKDKSYSGVFLGLAFLTRYNFIVFLPLLLLSFKFRKVLANLLAFFVIVLPWLVYNFIKYGNFLTSIADAYALNVKFRYYFNPFDFVNVLYVILFMLPFLLIGLFKLILKTKNQVVNSNKPNNVLSEKHVNLVILSLTVLIIYQYYITPLKDVRYIFPLMIPVAYFSAIGLMHVKRKIGVYKQILVVFITLNVLFIILFGFKFKNLKEDKYEIALDTLDSNNLSACKLYTNYWPYINYFGKAAEPAPHKGVVEYEINEGSLILLFEDSGEPEYASNLTFLNSKKVLIKNDMFILLGSNSSCKEERKVDYTYLSNLKRTVNLLNNYEINTNPCFILFSNSNIGEKICNLMNYGNFSLDSNRNLA